MREAGAIPEALRPMVDEALALEESVIARLRKVTERPLAATRTRIHGDFHLGQVLVTGGDFVIIDFEGEPLRPIGERRLRRSPLRDVAGMMRSFHYAAWAALFRQRGEGVPSRSGDSLESCAAAWHRAAATTFLAAYVEAAAGAPFLPRGAGDLEVLLDALLIEKALYEIAYELNNRPDWVGIPLQGLLDLVREREAGAS
jgi:trehalose synthase-fused probable maltokinase